MNHIALKSPAKLNLFLHITGQQENGYHEIQTLFQLINYCDDLTFTRSLSPGVRLITPLIRVPTQENLVYRAAMQLKATSQCRFGCDITINKRIPMGGGLGGGSSNAATTLLALNKLWGLKLSLTELSTIGEQLGADVPLFVHGHSAWGEGVGNILTPMILKPQWYLLLLPPVQVNTKQLYEHPELNRNCSPLMTATPPTKSTMNVFEPVVRQTYPEIAEALDWLSQHADAKLTGTGSTVFASFDSRQKASTIASLARQYWPIFLTESLNQSPVHVKLSAS